MLYINPLTSPGEVVSVFTSPYLSAGAPALGEAKGLINAKIKSNKIRILGRNFVKNNKNKGKLIINTIFLL